MDYNYNTVLAQKLDYGMDILASLTIVDALMMTILGLFQYKPGVYLSKINYTKSAVYVQYISSTHKWRLSTLLTLHSILLVHLMQLFNTITFIFKLSMDE